MPATDDEIMEVKDLLEDGKSVMHIVTETGQTVGCNPNEVSSSGMPHLENSEGLFKVFFLFSGSLLIWTF